MSSLAFIWDLDGTLLDSYEIIVSSLYKTYREFGIELKKDYVMKEVITYSVSAFISKMELQWEIPFETMKEKYSEISDREKANIKPVRHAKEILACLKESGARHFVFTHRGNSAPEVLSRLGLIEYFDEIITGKDGFPRKPDPAAINHLLEKYDLDHDNTFYVGDRTIDIECAENAGIQSIMYLPNDSFAKPTGRETYVVGDLLEIRKCVGAELTYI